MSYRANCAVCYKEPTSVCAYCYWDSQRRTESLDEALRECACGGRLLAYLIVGLRGETLSLFLSVAMCAIVVLVFGMVVVGVLFVAAMVNVLYSVLHR